MCQVGYLSDDDDLTPAVEEVACPVQVVLLGVPGSDGDGPGQIPLTNWALAVNVKCVA